MTRIAMIGFVLALAGGGNALAQDLEPVADPTLAAADTTDAPSKKGKTKVKRAKPVVFGYVQAHYRHARDSSADQVVDAPNFRMQRVRLGVKGDVYPWLSYDVEIDPRAPEVTGVLRDAYLAFKFIPDHQVRFGQQKTQFGYENRESSRELYAVNRTELSDSLSRGRNLRDIGVGLIGHRNLGRGWRFEDAITLVNGAGMNVQADDTRKKDVWGRLGLRYRNEPGDFTLRLGASGATGDRMNEGVDALDPHDDFREDFRRLGVDAEIDHRLLFVSAEYVKGTNENPLTGDLDEPSGYYVNLVGKTRLHVGPLARFDTLGDDFRRWTLGAYYGPPAWPFRVMVNYEYRKLRDGIRADDKLYVWTQVRF